MKLYLEIIEDLLDEEIDDGEPGVNVKEAVSGMADALSKFQTAVGKDYTGRAFHGFVHRCYHDEGASQPCTPKSIGRRLMFRVIGAKETKLAAKSITITSVDVAALKATLAKAEALEPQQL